MKNITRSITAFGFATACLLPSAYAQETRDLIEQRQDMAELTQQLEKLKTQLDIAKTKQELDQITETRRRQEQRASRPPEPQPNMTPEMIRRQIQEATQELEQRQQQNRPRDNSLDGSYIQEVYEPRDEKGMEAILNVKGRLIKVTEGSVIGDWRIKSISLGRVEAHNSHRDEHMIIGDGSSAIATNR